VDNFKRKYLGEAEPFLEQYAKRSPANLALIRAAGNMVQTENFLAILDAERDEEDGFQPEHVVAPSSPTVSLDVVSKIEGLIVFFPGNSIYLGTDFLLLCFVSTLHLELILIIRITDTLNISYSRLKSLVNNLYGYYPALLKLSIGSN
jgi:hypothetical protein